MSIPVPRAQPRPHRRVGLLVIAVCCSWRSTSKPAAHRRRARVPAGLHRGRRLLKPDDDVRIAGVKVGKVTGVDLDGDHVRVDFRVTEPRELRPADRRLGADQDDPRPEVPRARAGGRGPADADARSRCRARRRLVRRRRRLQRPRARPPSASTPTSWPTVPRRHGHGVQGQPEDVRAAARRPGPALPHDRLARRSSCARC